MPFINPIIVEVGENREIAYHRTPVGIFFKENTKRGERELIGFYRTIDGIFSVFPHNRYTDFFKIGMNTVLLPTDSDGKIPSNLSFLVAVPVEILYMA